MLARLPGDVSAVQRRIGFFPGSTIGNLLPVEATAFLRRARGLLEDWVRGHRTENGRLIRLYCDTHRAGAGQFWQLQHATK